jgi:hypothetical protein
VSTAHQNEQPIDPSNILYNDRQNYQVIFTNDSRFFDTSLHLFKSYCDLEYIKSDKKKSRKSLLYPMELKLLRDQNQLDLVVIMIFKEILMQH